MDGTPLAARDAHGIAGVEHRPICYVADDVSKPKPMAPNHHPTLVTAVTRA